MECSIELYHFVGLGLVIECPSGVTYTNQVGGAFNRHLRTEGVFVPLANRMSQDWPTWPVGSPRPRHAGGPVLDSPATELFDYFWGPKYNARGAEWGLDAEDAVFIDAVLAKHALADVVTVDRDRLDKSDASWVHVVVHRDWTFKGLGPYPRSGVITWPNSD